MGASQTKSEVLHQVLNKTSIEVMNKNSTVSSSVIDNTNEFSFIGNKNTSVSGITQINAAKINVAALQASMQSGTLISDLSAALSAAIEQEGTALGYSSSNAKVKSVVENNVKVSMTNSNLIEIRNSVKGSNIVKIMANENVDVTEVVQKNESELIAKLVSDMNSTIVSQLQTSGAVQTDLSQTTASLLSGYTVIILVVLAVLAGGVYFLKDGYTKTLENITKPAPMILIGCAIVLILIVVPLLSKE